MSILSSLNFHPLQRKRIDLESWRRQQREKLESDFKQQLKDIQSQCTHQWEDGKSAIDYTSPPFSDIYCVICNKFDFGN